MEKTTLKKVVLTLIRQVFIVIRRDSLQVGPGPVGDRQTAQARAIVIWGKWLIAHSLKRTILITVVLSFSNGQEARREKEIPEDLMHAS